MILKCRAWMIKEKAMVRVAQLPFLNEDGKPENYAVGFYGEESESGSSVDYTDLDNVILMQSAGLFDGTKWDDLSEGERNEWAYWGHIKENWHGREIYEGDIITTPWGAKETVERDKLIGGYKPFLTSDKDKNGMYPFDGKVIGNIYEGNIYERKKSND